MKKLKELLTLGSTQFFNTIMNTIFWFVLASLLTSEQYGELGYLFALAFTGQAIANLGTDRLIIVYGAKKENVKQPAYSLLLISTAITSVIFYVITQNIAISLLIWGFQIMWTQLSEINSRKSFLEFSKSQVIFRVLWLSLGLSFYFALDLNGIILGVALASVPLSGWIIKYVKNQKVSILVLKSKIKFMFDNYFSYLITVAYSWGGSIMIGSLFGFTVLGPYFFALQYVSALNAIPSSLMIYLLPQEAQKISQKSVKIFSIILSVILAILMFFLAPIIVDNFFPTFYESIIPMQIMVVGIIPWTLHVILEASFLGKGKSRIVLLATGIQTGTFFLLLAILGSEFGITGFAYSFLISIIIRALINSIVYTKTFQQSDKEL